MNYKIETIEVHFLNLSGFNDRAIPSVDDSIYLSICSIRIDK